VDAQYNLICLCRKVLFGDTSESIMDFYEVSSVHKHPEFMSLARNDIALLELERGVEYSGKWGYQKSFLLKNKSIILLRFVKTDLSAFTN